MDLNITVHCKDESEREPAKKLAWNLANWALTDPVYMDTMKVYAGICINGGHWRMDHDGTWTNLTYGENGGDGDGRHG